MRIGTELTARGRFFSGSFVSAAAVPTSSTPTNANTAIWKPAAKPMNPMGKMPPCDHRFENDDFCPPCELPVKIM